MHARLLARGTLAVALAAGCLAAARGGDTNAANSSWTARLWPGTWLAKKTPEGQKDAKGQPVSDTKTDIDAARRLRAEQDWKRRAEICQKLRQIAYETRDDELDRLAERLDQRAWDRYVKQGGAAAVRPASSQDGVERIGVDFNLIEPSAETVPTRSESTPAREDRR